MLLSDFVNRLNNNVFKTYIQRQNKNFCLNYNLYKKGSVLKMETEQYDRT